MSMIDDIKRDREAGTSPECGRWGWYGGHDSLYLATERCGRRFVVDFARKGMQSAQPRFQIGGMMYGAIDHLTKYVVGDEVVRGQAQARKDPSVYRMDVSDVDHPDARRIARVPDMEAALLAADKLAALAEKSRPMTNRAFGAGIEEREGGSARRQGQLIEQYEGWLRDIDAALLAYRRATGGGG